MKRFIPKADLTIESSKDCWKALVGVGLRFRDPDTPIGFKIEVSLRPDTMPKMKKLLSILGGKIIFREDNKDFIHIIVEKTDIRKDGH